MYLLHYPMKFDKDRFYVTVDAVVFTILNNELKILIIKRKIPPFKGGFALPGGFVNLNENLDRAAERELKEETGVGTILLKKLKPFGKVGRDPRGRVITVPYLAIISGKNVKLHSTCDAELARWHSVYNLPKLAFDHKEIISYALNKLRSEIERSNIAFQIIPKKFTLTELQRVYEIILNKNLDKRNFRKKLRELLILKELDETKMEGAHRPARLYSFRLREYRKF